MKIKKIERHLKKVKVYHIETIKNHNFFLANNVLSGNTMKNIIYIAPSEREHSSYYVFKEDQKPSVERFRNQECLDCPKQVDCLKIFGDEKFETKCSFPFWQRHGYPLAFNFMLVTARKTDNALMPRGYVRLPVISPNLMKKYDKIKMRNIGVFERKESLGWVQQRRQLKEFQEEYREKLYNEKGKIVSKDLIKAYLMDYFGERSFTTTEMDIFCAIVKADEIGRASCRERV